MNKVPSGCDCLHCVGKENVGLVQSYTGSVTRAVCGLPDQNPASLLSFSGLHLAETIRLFKLGWGLVETQSRNTVGECISPFFSKMPRGKTLQMYDAFR
eukprot:2769888-Amphidinium_carterae.1